MGFVIYKDFGILSFWKGRGIILGGCGNGFIFNNNSNVIA